jgi:hypothetical protein
MPIRTIVPVCIRRGAECGLPTVAAQSGQPRRSLSSWKNGLLSSSRAEVPNGYCPNHSTGVTLPADFKVTPLQYVD